jgi:serine/threonine-protein kinase
MHRDPENRFSSADAFRLALEGYLEHRGSLELVRASNEKLAELERVGGGPSSTDESAVAMDHRMRVLNLLGEARFGFREALASWPENTAAHEGLVRAVRYGVSFEIARDAVDSAAAMLAELRTPPRDLVEMVSTAQARAKARLSALEQLRTELDPNVGRRARLVFALSLGVVLVAIPHFAARLESSGHATETHAYRADLFVLLLILALAYRGRESLKKTAINRGFVWTTIFLFVCQIIVALGTTYGPLSATALFPMRFYGPLCAVGTAGILLEPRMLPAAAGYMIALFVEAKDPSMRAVVTSIANFLTLACFALAWIYPRAQKDELRPVPRR